MASSGIFPSKGFCESLIMPFHFTNYSTTPNFELNIGLLLDQNSYVQIVNADVPAGTDITINNNDRCTS